jgi:hypothetical protein
LPEDGIVDQPPGAILTGLSGEWQPPCPVAGCSIGAKLPPTLELEQVLGNGPAHALLANALGSRHAHIVENLIDLLLAFHWAVRA